MSSRKRTYGLASGRPPGCRHGELAQPPDHVGTAAAGPVRADDVEGASAFVQLAVAEHVDNDNVVRVGSFHRTQNRSANIVRCRFPVVSSASLRRRSTVAESVKDLRQGVAFLTVGKRAEASPADLTVLTVLIDRPGSVDSKAGHADEQGGPGTHGRFPPCAGTGKRRPVPTLCQP
jgi:hypothetical protein